MVERSMNEVTRTVEMNVPFRDVDMNGQVFLGSYISYAESVLATFWSSRPRLENEPLYIASKVTCILHRPMHYDERVLFTASVDKIGVRSVGFIISADIGDERSAEVEIIWQARSREDRSPVPLPEVTRDWLYGFVD
ncbi:putative thioesterase [Rhizobium sp. CF122]|nr:putative thioesterase [Rhizobium sp. CF122]TCM80842.1 (3S)-malyl-CoA thioesterase [Rhizobium sp. BK068]